MRLFRPHNAVRGASEKETVRIIVRNRPLHVWHNRARGVSRERAESPFDVHTRCRLPSDINTREIDTNCATERKQVLCV